MENVLLIIHLIIAVFLIGVVLLQRSEGGALGMGGGGGGVVSSRGAATALSKVTWGLAIAFICTSLGLGIIAASNTASDSVVDRIGTTETAPTAPGIAVPPSASDLLPPSPSDVTTPAPATPVEPDLPLVPPTAD